MIILGIDPGTAITGYGVIQRKDGGNVCVAYGVIRTHKDLPMGKRLVEISQDLDALFDKYKPDYVGVEELFFCNNVKTALTVGQARGVVLERIYARGIPCMEFTPLQIKQAMTGYGKATKEQIQASVKQWLKLSEIPKPDDAADGLAVALTVSHSVDNKIFKVS